MRCWVVHPSFFSCHGMVDTCQNHVPIMDDLLRMFCDVVVLSHDREGSSMTNRDSGQPCEEAPVTNPRTTLPTSLENQAAVDKRNARTTRGPRMIGDSEGETETARVSPICWHAVLGNGEPVWGACHRV